MIAQALNQAAEAVPEGRIVPLKPRKDATCDRLDRLLAALGYQLAVLPTRRGTAAAAACDAGEIL